MIFFYTHNTIRLLWCCQSLIRVEWWIHFNWVEKVMLKNETNLFEENDFIACSYCAVVVAVAVAARRFAIATERTQCRSKIVEDWFLFYEFFFKRWNSFFQQYHLKFFSCALCGQDQKTGPDINDKWFFFVSRSFATVLMLLIGFVLVCTIVWCFFSLFRTWMRMEEWEIKTNTHPAI